MTFNENNNKYRTKRWYKCNSGVVVPYTAERSASTTNAASTELHRRITDQNTWPATKDAKILFSKLFIWIVSRIIYIYGQFI